MAKKQKAKDKVDLKDKSIDSEETLEESESVEEELAKYIFEDDVTLRGTF